MVSTLKELMNADLSNNKKAAVVSGASTPQYIVDEIYNYLLIK